MKRNQTNPLCRAAVSLLLVFFLFACGKSSGNKQSGTVVEVANPGNVSWNSEVFDAINVDRWAVDENADELVFTGAGTGKLQWVRLSSIAYGNFTLEFEYSKDAGSVQGMVEAVVRAGEDYTQEWFPSHGYHLGTDQQSHFTLFKMKEKKIEIQKPWTQDVRIVSGLENWQKIKVEALGAQLQFFVDDNLIAVSSDSEWASGLVYLGIFDDTLGTKVRLRNLSLVVIDPTNQAPVVSISAPASGAIVSGVTSFSASASDPDGSISSVKFYVNGVLKSTDSTSPYSYSWDTSGVANGAATLKAVATDDDGATSEAVISVNVNNIVPNQAPVVSITAPASGASVSGVTSFSASASDPDGSISSVKFYVNGVLKTTDSTSPYSYSWDTSGVANGAATLKAVATDDDGATSEAVISVSVNNLVTVTFENIESEDGYVKAYETGLMPTVGLLGGLAVGRGGDIMHSRSVLSFDTSSLPDGAAIARVYLEVEYSSSSGNPWTGGNRLLIDVKKGTFGAAAIETDDWAAIADAQGVAQLDEFYSGVKQSTDFDANGLAQVNKMGKTQLKLSFENFHSAQNYIFLKSGSFAKLVVVYQP